MSRVQSIAKLATHFERGVSKKKSFHIERTGHNSPHRPICKISPLFKEKRVLRRSFVELDDRVFSINKGKTTTPILFGGRKAEKKKEIRTKTSEPSAGHCPAADAGKSPSYENDFGRRKRTCPTGIDAQRRN